MLIKLILHTYVCEPREVYAIDISHAITLKKHYAKQGFKVEVA